MSFRLEKRAYRMLVQRAEEEQRRVEQVPPGQPLHVQGRAGGVSLYLRRLVHQHLGLPLVGQIHGERTVENMNMTQRVTPTDRERGRVRLRADTKLQFHDRGDVLVSVKGSAVVRCRYDPNDSDGRSRSGLLSFRGQDKQLIDLIGEDERVRVRRDDRGVYHLEAVWLG